MRQAFGRGFFLGGALATLATATGGRFPRGPLRSEPDAEQELLRSDRARALPEARRHPHLRQALLGVRVGEPHARRPAEPPPDRQPRPREVAELWVHMCPAQSIARPGTGRPGGGQRLAVQLRPVRRDHREGRTPDAAGGRLGPGVQSHLRWRPFPRVPRPPPHAVQVLERVVRSGPSRCGRSADSSSAGWRGSSPVWRPSSMAGRRSQARGDRRESCFTVGTDEPAVQEELVRVLRPGGVVYDVGANVGFLTLIAARLVGPAGMSRLRADPRHARAIERNAALNGFANVDRARARPHRSLGRGVASHPADEPGAHLAVVGDAAGGRTTSTVRTAALDEFSPARPPSARAVVKLDVEGAELLALEGMRAPRRARARARLSSSTGHARAFEQLLPELGYDVTRVVRDTARDDWNEHAFAHPAAPAPRPPRGARPGPGRDSVAAAAAAAAAGGEHRRDSEQHEREQDEPRCLITPDLRENARRGFPPGYDPGPCPPSTTLIGLDDVLAAREAIGTRLHRTPMFSSRQLGERIGGSVHLKAELFQRTGSFKIRGVLAKLATLTAGGEGPRRDRHLRRQPRAGARLRSRTGGDPEPRRHVAERERPEGRGDAGLRRPST